jgi:hypothetical protein
MNHNWISNTQNSEPGVRENVTSKALVLWFFIYLVYEGKLQKSNHKSQIISNH